MAWKALLTLYSWFAVVKSPFPYEFGKCLKLNLSSTEDKVFLNIDCVLTMQNSANNRKFHWAHRRPYLSFFLFMALIDQFPILSRQLVPINFWRITILPSLVSSLIFLLKTWLVDLIIFLPYQFFCQKTIRSNTLNVYSGLIRYTIDTTNETWDKTKDCFTIIHRKGTKFWLT